jgi:hypothetical protein
MTIKQFANGAFVFFQVGGTVPRFPDELRDMAIGAGMDPDKLVPEYAGDRMAIFRTLRGQVPRFANRKNGEQRYVIRPIKKTKKTVMMGISPEQVDENAERVDHSYEGKLMWNSEPDPSTIEGDHPVAQEINGVYQDIRGKIVGDDWTNNITDYLVNDCAAMYFKPNYWVPPQMIAKVHELAEFLRTAVSIKVYVAELVGNTTVTDIKEKAQKTLADKLDELVQQVDDFDGTERSTVYTLRMQRSLELKKQANLYKSALGVGVKKMDSVLKKLELSCEKMMDLRQCITVHKDGTVSDKGSGKKKKGTKVICSVCKHPKPLDGAKKRANRWVCEDCQ